MKTPSQEFIVLRSYALHNFCSPEKWGATTLESRLEWECGSFLWAIDRSRDRQVWWAHSFRHWRIAEL